jgi:hypothetical protein
MMTPRFDKPADHGCEVDRLGCDRDGPLRAGAVDMLEIGDAGLR